MSFNCEKCERVFNRQNHLDKHMNRKIPCDRKLKCPRCFQEFNILGNLKQHVNKKNKCYDRKNELELQIKLEETKNRGKELDLKIAKQPITQIAGRDINNTTNNINNFTLVPMTWSDAYDNTIPGDVIQTLKNYFKYHYNNEEFPDNKCLIIKKGKIYAIKDDKLIDFDNLRSEINIHIRRQVDNVLDNYSPLDEETLISYNLLQRNPLLENDKIKTVEKIHPFVLNSRNTGVVKKQMISAVS
jgi:uncharacterized C2H2 Zn-finger protein